MEVTHTTAWVPSIRALAPLEGESRGSGSATAKQNQELTAREEKEVKELKRRDESVRQHEMAHFRAAGRYALGRPQYTFERGPDDRRYAVDGRVKIDSSKVPGDPRATLEKARTVRKAALAPRDPSAKDQEVAREAREMEREARRQLTEERDRAYMISSASVGHFIDQVLAAADGAPSSIEISHLNSNRFGHAINQLV